MTSPRGLSAVVLVAAVAFSTVASAAPIEIKVRTMLREKPASSARILDRLPAGKKLPMLGKTDDGRWVHVRSGPHDGWIQAAAVKGMRGEDTDASEAQADDSSDEPVRPMAKPRGVRPEAWVSKSRYHDGEDLKLIVSVNKAELYGRPSATGAVLGILRRGEQVQLVKKSADKRWVNVDIGGGETAWIDARSVKPGHVTSTPEPDESAQEEAAPPPTITPEGAKKKAKLAKVEPPPAAEEQQAEEPPPPPKKSKRQAKVEPPPPPPEEEKRPPRNIEDEAPPGIGNNRKPEEEKPRVAEKSKRSDEEAPPVNSEEKPSKKKRKQKKLASRTDETTAAESSEAQVVRDHWTTRGKVYLSPAVRAGIGILSQRFTSNGTGPLTNYESSTNAFGAQVGFGIFGTIGKYFLLGGDASYTFMGGASLKYVYPVDGTTIVLPVQSHTIDGGLSAGVHFGVLGGLNFRLRLGGQMVLNLIQPEVRTKLPSDRILGMTIGLGAGAPALFYLGGRPFGIQIYGGGIVPAQRAQTVGLEDGAQSTTFGAFFGAGVSYVLMAANQEHYRGQLAIEASYAYEFVATHYTGLARRNNTITIADRGSAQNLIALGLGWYY